MTLTRPTTKPAVSPPLRPESVEEAVGEAGDGVDDEDDGVAGHVVDGCVDDGKAEVLTAESEVEVEAEGWLRLVEGVVGGAEFGVEDVKAVGADSA